MVEVHLYQEHNHDTPDYLQQYFRVPIQPKMIYLMN
jgi:hypothetical protein